MIFSVAESIVLNICCFYQLHMFVCHDLIFYVQTLFVMWVEIKIVPENLTVKNCATRLSTWSTVHV